MPAAGHCSARSSLGRTGRAPAQRCLMKGGTTLPAWPVPPRSGNAGVRTQKKLPADSPMDLLRNRRRYEPWVSTRGGMCPAEMRSDPAPSAAIRHRPPSTRTRTGRQHRARWLATAAGCRLAGAVSGGRSRCSGGPPRPGHGKLTTEPSRSPMTRPVSSTGSKGGSPAVINVAITAASPQVTAARGRSGAADPRRYPRRQASAIIGSMRHCVRWFRREPGHGSSGSASQRICSA